MMRSGSSNLSQGDDRSFFVRRSSSVVRRPSSRERVSSRRPSVRDPSAHNQSINQSINPPDRSFRPRFQRFRAPIPVDVQSTHEPTNDGTGLKKPQQGVDRHLTKKKTGGKKISKLFFVVSKRFFFARTRARRNQTKNHIDGN